MRTTTVQPELLVGDRYGIYVMNAFCKAYAPYITNMEEVKEDFDICLEGTENEHYLDAWQNLESNVKLTNDKGEKFTIGYLAESGDLWAIPEGYEYPEE